MQNSCLYLPSYVYDTVSHPDSVCIDNKPSHWFLSFDDVVLISITFPLYCFIDTWVSELYTRQNTQGEQNDPIISQYLNMTPFLYQSKKIVDCLNICFFMLAVSVVTDQVWMRIGIVSIA